MVTRIICLLAINCKKKKCSIFITLRVTKTLKSSNALRRSCFSDVLYLLRLLKLEHFSFLQLIDNKKNVGYHKPMIDLGGSKKLTAVSKLLYFFLKALI